MENGKLHLNNFDWNDLNVSNINTFPSNKDLAGLAITVYSQKYGSKATYKKTGPNIKPLPDSWKLIATSHCKRTFPLGNGYNGAAYYNIISKHLVVAHRGTDIFRNPGSVCVDVVGVTLGRETSHMASAYHFTRAIVDKFGECAISISVTGHSLGGWLSQMSAFFIKHPDIANTLPSSSECDLIVDYLVEFNIVDDRSPSNHLHVVTFDSPGAFDIVSSNLLKYYPKYIDDRFHRERYMDDLDITTYFSSPDIVNVVNMHIGSLFMMRDIDTHSMKTIVQFWQSKEFLDEDLFKITDWPRGVRKHFKRKIFKTASHTEILAEPVDVHSFRMSIFESDEREFLKDIHNLKEQGVIWDKMSWETIFENIKFREIIDTANAIFRADGEFADYTRAKNIFDFFDSFELDEYHQVLTVTYNRFNVRFFIRLVKHFVRNSNLNLPAVVREVISNFPKFYRAFHREYVYINGIKEVRTGDILSLNEFLESSELRVYQAIAAESTLDCVTKMFSLLKSKSFLFRGDVNETLDMKHTLFLSSDLLTILDRQVGIAKITPPNDDLKVIVVENSCESIQPALESLIGKVLEAMPPSLKVIVVTKHRIHIENILPIDSYPFYLEKEMGASDQSVLFEHLTCDQQTEILESEICFQGENMQLKNLISLEELLSKADILSETTLGCFRRRSPTNKVSFGGTFNTLGEFERSYYIPRHFYKIVLTEPSQFLNIYHGKIAKNFVVIVSYRGINAKNQILSFVGDTKPFFEWHGSFQGFNRIEHNLILVESTTHRPNYNHFQSHFKELGLPAVWLFYDANKWYWHSSFGALDLSRFNVRYEERCNEQELLEIQQQLLIVCDEPGMGKSTLLKNLSELCKQVGRETGKSSWVIFVNLDSHVDLLRILKKSGDLVSVTNFLFQMDGSSHSNSIGKSILEYFLQIEQRVNIFFDGLDEVDDVIQSKVKDIVMTLLDKTKAKIFLASRIHLRYSLEYKFCCYSNTFLPLDNQEKVEFLTKFWTEHPQLQKFRENTIPISVITEKYAHQLLQELRVSLNIEHMDTFIGVPLQLFMLGTVSLPSISSFLSDVESNAGHVTDSMLQQNIVLFDNIFHLYQMFVEEKFHISLKEKLNLKQWAERNPWHYRQLISSLSEPHRTISFRFLFPNEFQEFVSSVGSNDLLNNENFQAILSVGIVQSDSIDLSSVQFIHRSVAEYFVADFLVSRLAMVHWKEKIINFLRRNYFHPQFEKIRFFVDQFISIQPECNPIFRKCLNFEKEKLDIFTMLDENRDTICQDLLGRNVLHYAICYGDHGEGILWCLIQNNHLFYEVDAFGCDFLSYFVLFNNSKLLVGQVDVIPDIYWILFISERMQQSIYSLIREPHDNRVIITLLRGGNEDEIEENEKEIAKLQTMITRDRKFYVDKVVSTFTNIVLRYWKRTETYLNAFVLALMTNSQSHMLISSNFFKTNFDQTIRTEMLSLTARDGCALFKFCVEHDESFEFEMILWQYCTKQRKEEEIYDFVKTTNFLTFRRICANNTSHFECHKHLIKFYIEFYKKLNDESLRLEMSVIAQNRIKELFKDDFPETASDEIFVHDIEHNSGDDIAKRYCLLTSKNYVKTFYDMLCFLSREDKERVLEERFEPLRLYITRKINSVDDNAKEFIDTICESVSSKVAGKYRELLKNR